MNALAGAAIAAHKQMSSAHLSKNSGRTVMAKYQIFRSDALRRLLMAVGCMGGIFLSAMLFGLLSQAHHAFLPANGPRTATPLIVAALPAFDGNTMSEPSGQHGESIVIATKTKAPPTPTPQPCITALPPQRSMTPLAGTLVPTPTATTVPPMVLNDFSTGEQMVYPDGYTVPITRITFLFMDYSAYNGDGLKWGWIRFEEPGLASFSGIPDMKDYREYTETLKDSHGCLRELLVGKFTVVVPTPRGSVLLAALIPVGPGDAVQVSPDGHHYYPLDAQNLVGVLRQEPGIQTFFKSSNTVTRFSSSLKEDDKECLDYCKHRTWLLNSGKFKSAAEIKKELENGISDTTVPFIALSVIGPYQ